MVKKSRKSDVPAPEQLEDLFLIDTKGDTSNVEFKPKKKGNKSKAEKASKQDDAEAELADLLFGSDIARPLGAPKGGAKGPKGSKEDKKRKQRIEDQEDEEIDAENEAIGAWEDDEGSSTAADPEVEDEEGGEQKAAWHDDDDESLVIDVASKDRLRKLRKSEDEEELTGTEFKERLRGQMNKMNSTVSWATRKRGKGAKDKVDQLLSSSGRLLGRSKALLPSAALDVERLKDANYQDVSDSVIQSVRFHPSNQLLLTAGLDKRLRLFQIDGKANSKVQGVFFEDLPINSAEFSADGEEIFVSGRRKHFYVYNLAAAKVSRVEGLQGRTERSLMHLSVSPDDSYLAFLGHHGSISLVSKQTKQWISDLKMNSEVRCAAFEPNGHGLYSAGRGGLVYHWDLRMRRCVRKIVDEGSMEVTALAISPVGGYLAAGSSSGIVNTYEMASWDGLSAGTLGEIRPPSRKAIMNLSTKTTTLRFNADSQILLMASQPKKEAMRMVHVASSNVFQNWPTSKTPLHYVSAADFSPSSNCVAIGNDRGKVLLYRLKHY